MHRTKKQRRARNPPSAESIRKYLLDYATKRHHNAENVIEEYLGEYYALEKCRQSLIYTLDDLTSSYEKIKESYKLRGKENDQHLKSLKKSLEKPTMELEYVIQKIGRSCSEIVNLINLLPDAEMKAVLELHYVEGLPLTEIRENKRLPYGRTKMNELHRKGLRMLHQILDL